MVINTFLDSFDNLLNLIQTFNRFGMNKINAQVYKHYR